MKYFRNTYIWLLTIILLGCVNWAQSQNQVPDEVEYLSPLPFSKNVTSKEVIAFRFSKSFSQFDLNEKDVQVFVQGSKSGELQGILKLADDRKTFIFRPDSPFVSNETIEVKILSPKFILSGYFQFQFLRGSLNDVKREQVAREILSIRFPETNQNQTHTPSDKKTNLAIKNDLPEGFPDISIIHSNNPSPGYIFIAPFSGSSFNIILDNLGTPVYYKETTNGTADFKVQPNGDITYYDFSAGKYYRMNSLYEIVDSVNISNGFYADMHELRMLENGNYLLMGIDPQLVNMDTVVPGGHPLAVVVGLVIQELDASKNVVFQWRSWDHFQITDASEYVNLNDSIIDYVHGNSIEIISDTNLLLSCRNMNEITNINRITGDIIWRLGGKNNIFDMVNFTDTFCMQHSIRLMPDSVNLSLFDNGNFHSPEPYSSAIEYHIDETTKTATMVDQIRNEPDIFGEFMGHAQRLENGNTIIGWGFGMPSVSEFDEENNKLLEISFPYPNYRAFKFDWQTSVFESNVDEINFGNIQIQDSAVQLIEISNNCNYPVEINRFLTNNNIFFPEESLPFAIPAHDTKIITIKFIGDSIGFYNDILTICWDIETDTLVQRIARQVRLSGSIGNQGFSENSGDINLLVFPNPFKKTIAVHHTDQIIETIKIYDHFGVLIFEAKDIFSFHANIQIEQKPGMYFLIGTLKNGVSFITKIIKQ